MYISSEALEETEKRLNTVLKLSKLVWHEEAYAFQEYPATCFPLTECTNAIAFVRDEDVWSVLKPASSNAFELFAIFSFHFPENTDNSGFVGWLATHIKRELGAGVFVVCGQNSKQGGIFDYWGIPLAMLSKAKELLSILRA